jgi:hypothetical protein
MLNFTGTKDPFANKTFTSQMEKTRLGEKKEGMQKNYKTILLIDKVVAGHVEFKAKTTPGTVKGIKSKAVEFDDIAIEKAFKGKRLTYLLIWTCAWEAKKKGYTSGTVKSIMTVGSYATFRGAGFPSITGASAKDRLKIQQIEDGSAEFKTNDDLRAASGEVSLDTIMGICEARIEEQTGQKPRAS